MMPVSAELHEQSNRAVLTITAFPHEDVLARTSSSTSWSLLGFASRLEVDAGREASERLPYVDTYGAHLRSDLSSTTTPSIGKAPTAWCTPRLHVRVLEFPPSSTPFLSCTLYSPFHSPFSTRCSDSHPWNRSRVINPTSCDSLWRSRVSEPGTQSEHPDHEFRCSSLHRGRTLCQPILNCRIRRFSYQYHPQAHLLGSTKRGNFVVPAPMLSAVQRTVTATVSVTPTTATASATTTAPAPTIHRPLAHSSAPQSMTPLGIPDPGSMYPT